MAWFIDPSINHGYPWNDSFPQSFRTDFIDNGTVRLPYYAWRIKAGVNNGYPWVYWWFKEDTPTGGEMVIGGSRTNYPNGFTSSNRGGLRDDFDTNSRLGGLNSGNFGGAIANTTIIGALDDRIFAISGGTLSNVLSSFNNTTIFDDAAILLIANMYGANIFDSIISCKVFPFDIGMLSYIGGSGGGAIIGTTADIKAFGRYTLASGNKLNSSMGYYDFPTIHVAPKQAWEIENVDFSIFLPMSGLYPLDLRGECDVNIELMVDLITGAGEYYVYIDEQLVGTYRVLLATDVPVNNNQGRMQENMLTNVISSFGNVASTALATGGRGGAIAASAIQQLIPTEHFAMSTPTVGGLSSMQCYAYPYITIKIPKMFKDGVGYEETLGVNRSCVYVRLSECSGYVQCANYKTDIIVATDTEKAEIEKLMNAGVFL